MTLPESPLAFLRRLQVISRPDYDSARVSAQIRDSPPSSYIYNNQMMEMWCDLLLCLKHAHARTHARTSTFPCRALTQLTVESSIFCDEDNHTFVSDFRDFKVDFAHSRLSSDDVTDSVTENCKTISVLLSCIQTARRFQLKWSIQGFAVILAVRCCKWRPGNWSPESLGSFVSWCGKCCSLQSATRMWSHSWWYKISLKAECEKSSFVMSWTSDQLKELTSYFFLRFLIPICPSCRPTRRLSWRFAGCHPWCALHCGRPDVRPHLLCPGQPAQNSGQTGRLQLLHQWRTQPDRSFQRRNWHPGSLCLCTVFGATSW